MRTAIAEADAVKSMHTRYAGSRRNQGDGMALLDKRPERGSSDPADSSGRGCDMGRGLAALLTLGALVRRTRREGRRSC